jgi:hypothetical protein
MLLTLYDWNDQLTVADLIHALPETVVCRMTSAGSVLAVNGKKRTRAVSLKTILAAANAESIEVEASEPPRGTSRNVFSYINRKGKKTLIISGDRSVFSWESCFAYLQRIASHGNLGYGYADSRTIDERAVYFALGISFGHPTTPEEQAVANTISRWFRERIPMKTVPPLNRHLTGFFRDVFEVNIITDSHLGQLCEDGNTLQAKIEGAQGALGYIESLANQSYVWVLPLDTRRHARKLLEDGRVII